MQISRSLLILLLILFSAATCIVSEAAGPDATSSNKTADYSKELPRVAPLEPSRALESFRLLDGFRIEQVAAEPLVTDPVAMAFDEDGRLYVVEMRGYSEQGDQDLGRIRLLEDTDHDGDFDQSHIFSDEISWPTAVACYRGGVFVGAAPYIFYLRDEDGDGKADRKEIVCTGFGRGNVQGLLNSFQWGLDNRIHGATSSSGGEVSWRGQPKLSVLGRDFAVDPLANQLLPSSGGGQHGMTFNRWGDKFVCHNSDHFQMIVSEDRYLARNPFLASSSANRSIAADGPQAEVFRSSPVEPWRILRTRLRVEGNLPGKDEGGGRPSGFFTSATGITVYEGDAWPEVNRGDVFVADVGSNLVHRKRLLPRGAIYSAERIDAGREFLTSDDTWFRPVQMCNGPDGALYIADMYREVIEHPLSLPEEIKRHLDLTSGRDRGRIYRIVPTGFHQPDIPRLSQANSEELVDLLDHSNAWHRRTASRLLYERQDATVVPSLREVMQKGRLPEGRIAALYALEGLDQLQPTDLLSSLTSEHPEVQRHAVRLSETMANDSQSLHQVLFALVDTAPPRVLRQLAFSLGEMTSEDRFSALAGIANRSADDPLILEAVATSLNLGAGQVLARLLDRDDFRETEAGREFMISILEQIAKQQDSDDLEFLSRYFDPTVPINKTRMLFICNHLGISPGDELLSKLGDTPQGSSPEWTDDVLLFAKKIALDGSQSQGNRIDAIGVLRWLSCNELLTLSEDLFHPSESEKIQSAVLESISQHQVPEVAEYLIQHWRSLTPALRRQAATVLYSRPEWASALLDSIENGELTLQDMGSGEIELLAAHPNLLIRERAAKLLSDSQQQSHESLLKPYISALEIAGDVSLGAQTFRKHCASCHRHRGIGNELGPNLSMVENQSPQTLMLNILAPNAEVNPRYFSYVVLTRDGLAHAGLIAFETATTVTLQRTGEESLSILRSDIDSIQSTGLSLMPNDLGQEIDVHAMADLIAFLRSHE